MLVTKKAPDFTAAAVLGNNQIVNDFNLYKNIGEKGAVVFFYPMDFTFVCPSEIIDIHTASDGRQAELLITPGCGSAFPASDETLKNRLNFIHMSGNEVFKIAVQTLSKSVIEILHANKMQSEDIDFFIPHQANIRIIDAVKNRLNFTDEQCVLTVAKYGNTSSASIPMAINDAYEDGRIKNGSVWLLDAFGGGFTWGSAILKFGGKNFSDL